MNSVNFSRMEISSAIRLYLKSKTPLLRDVDIDELMAGLTEEELLALDAELERDVIQETSHNPVH